MTVKLRDTGATLRTVRGFKMRDGGATLRTVKLGKIRDAGGTLRTFFSIGVLAVTPLTADIGQTKSTVGPNKYFELPHTLTVLTGAGGYTYAWSKVSGSTIIAATPTNAATITFSTTLSPDEAEEATWKCIVTDAAGATATCLVNVRFNLAFFDIGGTA